MPTHRDMKSATPPNIQDVFLNSARRERLPVTIRLLDGQLLDGRIKNCDRFARVVEHDGADHMRFKHAIATIRSRRAVSHYFPSSASHDA